MSSNEETFRRLLTELRLLEGTSDTLQNRIALVNSALTELAFSSATLDGLEKEQKGAELLVPIGGGSFIKAKATTTKSMVVGIGAGVSVEKSRSEAREIVNKRIGELEKSRNALQNQLSQILERIGNNKKQLDEISVKMRSKGRLGNVRTSKAGS